jgi:HDOD domain
VRLGLRTVRDLALEAALHTKVFRVPGYDDVMGRLYRHSTATAHVMRMMCKRANVKFEYGFLAGLLHDVGFAAGLLALAERPEWRGARFGIVAPVLDAVHADASGQLAKRWGLPGPLQEVIAHHHALEIDGEARPVNAALVVAEQLCWEAGAGMLPPPNDADPGWTATPAPPLDGLDVNGAEDVERARQVLGLEMEAMAEARREAFSIVDTLGEKKPG